MIAPVRRATRLALALLALVGLLLAAGPAAAHPWMNRHGYAGCVPCHADPSGGGLLTAYGRAQGDILLRSTYGRDEAAEPSPTAGLLFGALTPPDDVLLGGSLRSLFLWARTPGAPPQTRFVQMQADMSGQVTYENLILHGSAGYAHEGALAAAVTHRTNKNLVSREHWVGVSLTEGKYLLRAGRIALPFGIRDIDHTLWARTATRTDHNTGQQHGVALSYVGDDARAEVMAFAGNLQVSPTYYRDRGYSGFVEAALRPDLFLGMSSLLTHVTRDVSLRLPLTRHAHGAFARLAPFHELVLLAEGNALFSHPTGAPSAVGYVGALRADLEVVQGVHVLTGAEVLEDGGPTSGPSAAARLGLWWFFAPHADARVDAVQQRIATPAGSVSATSFLAQLHLYL